jgi:protein-L-isoaspartate(D-aspartate) O-methyltransferase
MGHLVSPAGDEQFFTSRRQAMVAEQLRDRGISDERVLAAFEQLPRHLFVPPELRNQAYEDHPLPIGFGQTISQAYVVAFAVEALDLNGSERVLDVGTGSGYQAAVLALLAAEVHTVEIVPELAHQAAPLLSRLGLTNVHFHAGDGSKGWPESAPYNAIAAAAAARRVPPALLQQLAAPSPLEGAFGGDADAKGGRLVLPVGEPGAQRLELWERRQGGLHSRSLLSVAYVPMRGESDGWQ